MAEYIEREAFIESQQHLYCENCARRKDGKGKFVYDIGDAPCRACGIMDVLDAVADLPAADVRPVVLCRDCIHLSGITNGGTFFRCDRYDRWQDESNRVYMPLDGFCSYGQKQEET